MLLTSTHPAISTTTQPLLTPPQPHVALSCKLMLSAALFTPPTFAPCWAVSAVPPAAAPRPPPPAQQPAAAQPSSSATPLPSKQPSAADQHSPSIQHHHATAADTPQPHIVNRCKLMLGAALLSPHPPLCPAGLYQQSRQQPCSAHRSQPSSQQQRHTTAIPRHQPTSKQRHMRH